MDNKESFYSVCKDVTIYQVDDNEDFFDFLMDYISDEDEDCVSIIADVNVTRDVLYYSLNGDYDIDYIELDPNEEGEIYMTTIMWEDDNFSVMIEPALLENNHYAASDNTMFIQFDLPNKCEYLYDILDNKYIDPTFNFFIIGEECEEEHNDETNDKSNVKYTYANECDDGDSYGAIFVSSNDNDFVETVKEFFEKIFC